MCVGNLRCTGVGRDDGEHGLLRGLLGAFQAGDVELCAMRFFPAIGRSLRCRRQVWRVDSRSMRVGKGAMTTPHFAHRQ